MTTRSTATPQTSFSFPRPRPPRTHGGKRRNAGRKPPPGRRASERHRKRPVHDPRHPVHVTCRVLPVVGRLRKRHAYKIVQWACARASEKFDRFRICHLSIQGNHLHLIVEAATETALARGMQGFQISCARLLNGKLGRKGQVFADRYHAVALTTPTQVRNAMVYVLNNWRRHREDRGVFATRHDVYSTGLQSPAWLEAPPVISLRGIELLPVSFPTTWLLEHGWKRLGPISPWARPGPRA